MKLKSAEALAFLLLLAVIIYAAVLKNSNVVFIETSTIKKHKLKEDSTVILIDMPPVKTEDMFHYSYENKN